MIKNRIFALCFRVAAFLVCLSGVVVNIGVFKGAFEGVSLLYYTIQSNLLVIILLGVLIFKTAKDLQKEGKEGSCSYYPRISAGVLICVMFTFVVFWAILAPNAGERASYLGTFINLSVHLMCPLLMLTDYILFTVRGKLKKRDPFIFSIVPLVYFIQATILGLAGVNYQLPMDEEAKRFPYFFMDYFVLGWLVALFVVIAFALFLGLAYLLWFIDKRLRPKEEDLNKGDVYGKK